MLTPPPVNAGAPRAPAIERRRSIMNNGILLHQTLVNAGALVEIASLGSGYTTADLAQWLGTTLIRWAEQDRAATAESLNRGA
jgi:hypothetical protein